MFYFIEDWFPAAKLIFCFSVQNTLKGSQKSIFDLVILQSKMEYSFINTISYSLGIYLKEEENDDDNESSMSSYGLKLFLFFYLLVLFKFFSFLENSLKLYLKFFL
jgi:hypothetical protein